MDKNNYNNGYNDILKKPYHQLFMFSIIYMFLDRFDMNNNYVETKTFFENT